VKTGEVPEDGELGGEEEDDAVLHGDPRHVMQGEG
jgi:hypothetical protein